MDPQPRAQASSPSKPYTKPLAELSPNKTSPTKSHYTASSDIKSRAEVIRDENAMQQQDGAKHTYISPSDNIMSPTTKKLSEIKGRRFGAGKPLSLFAKTLGKQALRSDEKLAGASAGAGQADP